MPDLKPETSPRYTARMIDIRKERAMKSVAIAFVAIVIAGCYDPDMPIVKKQMQDLAAQVETAKQTGSAEQVRTLQQASLDLEKSIGEFRKELGDVKKSSTDGSRDLDRQFQELQGRVKKIENQNRNKNRNEALKNLETKLDDQATLISSAQESVANHTTRLGNIDKLILASIENDTATGKKTEELQVAITGLSDDAKSVRDTIKQLAGDSTRINESITKLSEQSTTIQAAVKKLTDQSTTMVASVKKLDEQTPTKELKSDIEALGKKVTDSQKTTNQAAADLKKKVDAFDKQLAQLKQKLAALEEKAKEPKPDPKPPEPEPDPKPAPPEIPAPETPEVPDPPEPKPETVPAPGE